MPSRPDSAAKSRWTYPDHSDIRFVQAYERLQPEQGATWRTAIHRIKRIASSQRGWTSRTGHAKHVKSRSHGKTIGAWAPCPVDPSIFRGTLVQVRLCARARVRPSRGNIAALNIENVRRLVTGVLGEKSSIKEVIQSEKATGPAANVPALRRLSAPKDGPSV
ncbi:hypothetical protein CSAL01_05588 [Colletotrichum salicis]|uniref:Uncharacterized protein n=1 Tax=Colletotrichum salicis TaxID=1209931 RepID=A0A135SI09_9PEZI|nr:hypothetical protein CSAL01_05588 [Colletotrichum salicis]